MNTAVMNGTSSVQTEVVTVKYVNPPKAKNRSGSIKDTQDRYFGAWPDKLKMFEEGATYEIAFNESANGFRNIMAAKRLVGEAEPPPNELPLRGTFTQVDMQPPQRNGATLMARTTPRPAPQAAPRSQPASPAPASSQQYYRPTAPRDAERMFVCATLGHFIDTGRLECSVEELTERVNILRDVWQNTFGADEN